MNYFEVKGNNLAKLERTVKMLEADLTTLFNPDCTVKKEAELQDVLSAKFLFTTITRSGLPPYAHEHTSESYQHYLGSILRNKFPDAPSASVVSSKADGLLFHHVADINEPAFLLKDYNGKWNNEYEFVFIPSFFMALYRLFTILYSLNRDGMDAVTCVMIKKELQFCLLFLDKASHLYDPRVFFGLAVLVKNWPLIMKKVTYKDLLKTISEIMNLCQADDDLEEEQGIIHFVNVPQQYKTIFAQNSAEIETAYVEHHYYLPKAAEHYLHPTKLIEPNAKGYQILLASSAFKQEKELLSPKGPIALRKPIKKRLLELSINPKTTRFKFEWLQHNWSGYCSIRVTKKDRIIYKMDELSRNIVKLYTLYGHNEV